MSRLFSAVSSEFSSFQISRMAVWIGCLAVAAFPATLSAQTATPEQTRVVAGSTVTPATTGATGDPDSYDSKALRLETHMGDFRIVRGLDGPVVGRIGLFSRPDLASLVAPSENAMKEGREFNRNHGPGMAAGITGMVVFAVSLAASSAAGTNWGLTAGTIGGGALMVYGAVRLDKAYSSLSKSIWWYNRDLKR
ncbi:MAG: hypothetical protein ACREMS_00595 [Gemmatimonadaceae bacterium]